MSQTVDLEVFYPHPPKRVWQVLTNRRALAAWMMENDFEPKLGHKFQFYSQPLPGLKAIIQCEIVELEEPSRLAYTWQESPTTETSLVVWTLVAVTGGTKLCLKHYQYSYTTATASNHSGNGSYSYQNFGLSCSNKLLRSSEAIQPLNTYLSEDTAFNTSITAIAPQLSILPKVDWHYFLDHTLPALLAQD